MTTPFTRLMVAIVEQTVFLKIIGRANVTISVNFKTVIQELLSKGYSRFVVDVAECPIMDSTFVGVLTGLTLKMKTASPPQHGPVIQLRNPQERVASLLDNLGVSGLFGMASGLSPQTDYTEYETEQANAVDLTHTSLEAHQILMQINPDNVPKFKEVAEFLAEDLQKLKSKIPPSDAKAT